MHSITHARAAGLLLLAVAAPVRSQVTGTVVGFAGEPVAAAVRAIGAGGELLDETLSGPDGAFTLQQAAKAVRLAAQIEAVIVEQPLAAAAAPVALSFAGVAVTTVRGSAFDPGGAPAAGRDLLFRDAKGKAVATATLDGEGAFALRANVVLRDALLDPLGWRHVVPGPFVGEREARIDLRDVRATFFRLHGRVVDEAGRPADGWRVQANGERARAAATTTAGDGTFTLWCNQPVVGVEAHASMPRLGRLGSWRADAELALDERADALRMVCGRFVDANDEPLARAMLIPSATDGPPRKGTPAVGGTDRDGRFAVRLVRGTPFLFAVSADEKLTASAPVPVDGAPLVLRPR
jgi:hypothetical protein